MDGKVNRTYCGIMGLVVGDALGVPYEFKERDTYKITGMEGFGTHNQPPGTWSDDSSMTIATMESIARLGKIDINDIMQNFEAWLFKGEFTPYGEVFDCGRTCRSAIKRFHEGREAKSCGCKGFNDNGNGSLMRILPLAFVPHTKIDVYYVSCLTHAHEIAIMGCQHYIQICEKLLNGSNKLEAIQNLMDIEDYYGTIPNVADVPRDKIRSSGYVVDTLEAAVWSFVTTDSYKECVITAAELGNDTDTVAAIAGGLAGIYYGIGNEKGIPQEWIDVIPRKEYIRELCEKDIFMI